MNNTLIKISLLIIVLYYAAFPNPESIMRTANEYYKNNRYQLAVDEYNKLIDDGYSGVSLYYNLAIHITGSVRLDMQFFTMKKL